MNTSLTDYSVKCPVHLPIIYQIANPVIFVCNHKQFTCISVHQLLDSKLVECLKASCDDVTDGDEIEEADHVIPSRDSDVAANLRHRAVPTNT